MPLRNAARIHNVHWDASKKIWSPYVTKKAPWPFYTRNKRRIKWGSFFFFGTIISTVAYHWFSRLQNNLRGKGPWGAPKMPMTHEKWQKADENSIINRLFFPTKE